MHTLRSTRGMTLIELIIVITLIGLMAAMVVPRLRVSNQTKVRQAADVMVRDLEQARTRAMSTRSNVRIVFSPTAPSTYTGYLDFDRDTLFALSTQERDSLRAFGTRQIADGVVISRGGATPDLPSNTGAGAVTFTGSLMTFDTRGLITPFGSRGVIYFTHPNDATAIAAVSITGGGSIRRYIYRGGSWQ